MAINGDATRINRILGPDGNPYAPGPDTSLALPSVITFSGVINSASRVYPHGRHDVALRLDKEFALAMRNDVFTRGLMQERKLATVSQKWSIEVDNERDPWQKAVKDTLTRVFDSIPYRKRQMMYLLECVWYGRYASQVSYDNADWFLPLPNGLDKQRRRVPIVKTHAPINGDKIDYLWDGTPAIQVAGMYAKRLEEMGAEIVQGTNSRVMPLRGTWRTKFIIAQHEAYDADFNMPEAAGSVHGVGIRDTLYYLSWLRAEWLGNTADWCERFGMGGVRLGTIRRGTLRARRRWNWRRGRAAARRTSSFRDTRTARRKGSNTSSRAGAARTCCFGWLGLLRSISAITSSASR